MFIGEVEIKLFKSQQQIKVVIWHEGLQMFYRTVGTKNFVNGRWNKNFSNGSRMEKNLSDSIK